MELEHIQRIQTVTTSIDSIRRIQRDTGKAGKTEPAQKTDFAELLNRAVERQSQLHFSRHVQQRLQQRQVNVDADQLQQLNQALQLAQQKGIRDSLVLTRDAAFIVNVPSKTVVTAMQRDAVAYRVFTNIDGAIVTS